MFEQDRLFRSFHHFERCFRAAVRPAVGATNGRHSAAYLYYTKETVPVAHYPGDWRPHAPPDRKPNAIRQPGEPDLASGTARRRPTRPRGKLETQCAKRQGTRI